MRAIYCLIALSVVAVSCAMKPDRGKKIEVLVRGDPAFTKKLAEAGTSIEVLEEIGLKYKAKKHPKKARPVVGPVVAIVDGRALLTSPNKNGEFGLHGVFIDLKTKYAKEENLVDLHPKAYKVKEHVRPLIWGEKKES